MLYLEQDGDKWQTTLASENFYLSESLDPQKELSANIKAYRDNADYKCHFPARALYITQNVLHEDLDLSACEKLKHWMGLLNPRSVSIGYPTHSLENSLAVFSHTFLKFNNKEYPKNSHLNISLSFAAEFQPGDSIFVLGIKGILGGYAGKYGTAYYYDEVNRYSEKGARDIFDYELNLNENEINKIIYHIWEVRNHYFRYYFIKENCSYYLLRLLEIARPRLALTTEHPLITVPSESLKSMYKYPELIKKVQWYPSRKTRTKQMNQLLTNSQKELKNKIYNDPKNFKVHLKTLKLQDEKIQILDAIISETQNTNIKNQALELRAKAPITEYKDQTPDDIEYPHTTHGGQLLSFGVAQVEKFYGPNLRFRFSLHELLDPPHGYSPEASVAALDLNLKFIDQNFDQSSLTMIRMYALKDILEGGFSWKGVSHFSKIADHIDFENSLALGPAFAFNHGHLYFMYGIFTHINHGHKRKIDLAHGTVIGLAQPISSDLRIFSEYRFEDSVYELDNTNHLDFGLTFDLKYNHSIQLSFNRINTQKGGSFKWNHYF